MTLSNVEFKTQIDRLNVNWPRSPISKDRSVLIYNTAKSFTGYEFKKVIDTFIASRQFPPLPADFNIEFSVIRERRIERERQIHRRESEEFQSNLHSSEVSYILQGLAKRMNGTLPNSEWQALLETTLDMAKAADRRVCKKCEMGIVRAKHEAYTYVFRCTCTLGRNYGNQQIMQWEDSMTVNFKPIDNYKCS